MDELLVEIWLDAKPALLERCEAVQRAAASGDGATFDDARAESHKLAGSVGMFGLTDAGALASAMDALVSDDALTDDRRHQVADLATQLRRALQDER